MKRALLYVFVALWLTPQAFSYQTAAQTVTIALPHVAGDPGNFSGGQVNIEANASISARKEGGDLVIQLVVNGKIEELGGDGTRYDGQEIREIGRLKADDAPLPDLSKYYGTLKATEAPNHGNLPKQFDSGATPLAPASDLVLRWSVLHDEGKITLILKSIEVTQSSPPPPTSTPPGHDPINNASSSMDPLQIVSASVGLFLILLILFLVFKYPILTPAQYTFCRIAFALAAGCLAVLICGFLSIQYKGVVQAGGGFAVFIIVYYVVPAEPKKGAEEWKTLSDTWRALRDLSDDVTQVNQDDLVTALNAVNNAATLIDDDDRIFAAFQQVYGRDYCGLYKKLLNRKYPLVHMKSTSDLQLQFGAHNLANRLSC